MEDGLQYLIQNPYITVLIAVVVFILSLVFVVKRIFSFVITLIILLVCLFAGYVIIYPQEATKVLESFTEEGRQRAYENNGSSKSLNERAKDAYDAVKESLEEYSEKIK